MEISCPFCFFILSGIDKDYKKLSEIMTNGSLEFLRFCTEATEIETKLVDKLHDGRMVKEHDEEIEDRSKKTIKKNRDYSWIGIQNRSECQSEFDAFEDEIRHFSADPTDQSYILPIFNRYEENVVKIYVNGTNNHSSVREHQQCLQLREDFLSMSNQLHKVFELNADVRETDNMTEAIVYVEQIIEINQKLSSFPSEQSYYTKIKKKCNWLYNYDTTRDDALLQTLVAGKKGTFEHLNRAIQQFSAMKVRFEDLRLIVEDTIVPMTELVEAYMQMNITKKTLAKDMVEAHTPEVKGALMVKNNEMKELLMAITTEMNLGKSMMENMYISLAKLELALITKENVDDLELVKSTLEINDSRMDEIIDTLTGNMVECLHDLVDEIFLRLTSPIDGMKLSVAKSMDEIVEKFDALKIDLEAYRNSMVMDADFYM